ncbi:hypothetical protein J4230_03585 [Candidatus Woesearchaeota archaeon]|nr:hypothetical protein [Candidatus Woesearchaeota archaeon]
MKRGFIVCFVVFILLIVPYSIADSNESSIECPYTQDGIEALKKDCSDKNGKFSLIESNGCSYPVCDYPPPPPADYTPNQTEPVKITYQCQKYSEEQIDFHKSECEKVHGEFVMRNNSNNCEIPDCLYKCTITNFELEKIRCEKEYNGKFETYIVNGCKYSRCSAQEKTNNCYNYDLTEEKKSCETRNGTFAVKKNENGCEYSFCDLKFEQSQSFSMFNCPPINYQEINRVCASSNASLKIEFKNNCEVASCKYESVNKCPVWSAEVAERCDRMNSYLVEVLDENGCKNIKCIPKEGYKSICTKEIPNGMKEKCKINYGGNLFVKKDENGCIIYMDCIYRGNKEEIEFEEVSKLPETSELISIALKIENLKVNLNKIYKQLKILSDYYKVEDKKLDADKFLKAANLINSANDKLEEIKSKLKSRDINEKAVIEVKHDLVYIDKVILKDVLYILLGGEESRSVVEEKNCDLKDHRCFEENFRVCNKVIYSPEEHFEIKIEGLDDNKCLVNFKSTETGNMICRFENYAFGFDRNLRENREKSCTGSMMNKFKDYEWDKNNYSKK